MACIIASLFPPVPGEDLVCGGVMWGGLFLAVLVGLVQFRQQRLEHFDIVDQLGSHVDAQRKGELGQIPRDLAAHSRRRDVRDVGQPVHERFRSDCETGVCEDECTKKGAWALASNHVGCRSERWRL